MNAARIGLVSGLVLALLVTVTWLVPAVLGPFAVDCGELEPSACDRAWREVASAEADQGAAFLPITGVRITGAINLLVFTARGDVVGYFSLGRDAGDFHVPTGSGYPPDAPFELDRDTELPTLTFIGDADHTCS